MTKNKQDNETVDPLGHLIHSKVENPFVLNRMARAVEQKIRVFSHNFAAVESRQLTVELPFSNFYAKYFPQVLQTKQNVIWCLHALHVSGK